MNHGPQLLLSQIDLSHPSSLPLNRRLYEALRGIILEGKLRGGQRLPSTREMSSQLGVSRTTILIAFENLMAEGYILGKAGSGTFVSPSIPEQFLTPAKGPNRQASFSQNALSNRGKVLGDSVYPGRRNMTNLAPFRPGIPALRDFPMETWARMAGRQMRRLPYESFGYGDPAGYGPLRQAISDYLIQTRAVRCVPEQILIVNGSQQGLSLVAQVLLDPGDSAWIEDPGYTGAREAFSGAGLNLVPIPVDAQGMQIPGDVNPAGLTYITPSHQYPLGVTMSLTRRLQLLEHAKATKSWILEDDYDSEYRFGGKPLSSLQGLDTTGKVIYMGTLSKVLFPGIRLGYLVVPETLVDVFVSARAKMDRSSPILQQATLAQFMEEGFFLRHIRKMRLLYQQRQDFLLSMADRYLKDLLLIGPSETGLHVMGRLQNGFSEEDLLEAINGSSLIIPTLGSFTRTHFQLPGVVMGYAAFSNAEIEAGVKKLSNLLHKFRNK